MIHIVVSYATPEKQMEIPLEVEENCSIAMAIRHSGLLTEFPELDLATLQCGIFSQKAKLDDTLNENDRVEIYRPLSLDPKIARRLRAKKA